MIINSKIWEVLGIEPTSDIRAIKKAYASMSKKYHPEEMPDEFRNLYDAYKNAIKYAESQQNQSDIQEKKEQLGTFSSDSLQKETEEKFDFAEPQLKSPHSIEEEVLDFSKLKSKAKVTVAKSNGFEEEMPEFDELIEKGKTQYQEQLEEHIQRVFQDMEELYRKGGGRTKTERWRKFLQTKEFLSVQYEPSFIERLIPFLEANGKIPDRAWEAIFEVYFVTPDNTVEYKPGYGELYEYLLVNGNEGGYRRFYERRRKLGKISIVVFLALPIVVGIMLRYEWWLPASISFIFMQYLNWHVYTNEKNKIWLRDIIFIELFLVLVFAYAFNLPNLVIKSEWVVGTILTILLVMFLYGRKRKIVWMMLLAFLGLSPLLVFLIYYFMQDYIDVRIAAFLMALVLFWGVYISKTKTTSGKRLERFCFPALKVLGAICVLSFIIRTVANEPNGYALQKEPQLDVLQDDIVTINKERKESLTRELLQKQLGEDWEIVALLDDKEYKIIPTDEELIEALGSYVTGDNSVTTPSEFWDEFTVQLTGLSIIVELNMGTGYALKVVSPNETEDIWFIVMDGEVTYNIADDL